MIISDTRNETEKFLNTFVATLNKILNQFLQLKKLKKINVHQLLPTMCLNAELFVET